MKYFLIILSLSVLGAIIFWPSSKPHQETQVTEQTKSILLPKRRKILRKMHFEPRSQIIKDQARTRIPVGCETFWNQILKLSLDKDVFLTQEQSMPNPSGCTPSKHFEPLQRSFMELCHLNNNKPLSSPVKISNCRNVLFYFRASITDYLTEGMELSDISDSKVLVDKLFSQYLANPVSGAKVAQRLLELHPDYYPAAQAIAISSFTELVQTAKEEKINTTGLSTLASHIDRLKQMNPEDPKPREMEILTAALLKKDPILVREKANEFFKDFPNSYIGPYYLAWAEYKMGNPSEGWQWLNTADNNAPNNPYVTQTKALIKSHPDFYLNKKETSVFQTDLSFLIDNPEY